VEQTAASAASTVVELPVDGAAQAKATEVAAAEEHLAETGGIPASQKE